MSRIRVRCKRGTFYQEQGVVKTSSSNISPCTKCEDRNHRPDLCNEV